MKRSLWARWKRFAHRAAEIQSVVVLSILYWLIVAPAGLLRRRPKPSPPAWTPRPPAEPIGLDEARRQY